MKMQRIIPIMTAALVAGACTGDPTSPTAADGTLAAPVGPRMEGSQMGGSGGFTGVGEEPVYNSTTGGPALTDTTALTGRGSQMGGSGG